MSDYVTRLRNIYVSEARGDAFFGALADRQPDAGRREKLKTLQTVEARTVTSLNRLLERAGIHVETNQARREGRELAATVDDSDWSAFIRGLQTTIGHDAAQYEALRALAPEPNDPALTALRNHVRAIRDFVDLEAAGQSKKSLRILTSYLWKPA
jgi:hypothetical protein